MLVYIFHKTCIFPLAFHFNIELSDTKVASSFEYGTVFFEFTAAVVSSAYIYFKQKIHHYNYELRHTHRHYIKIRTICCLKKVIKSANFEIGLRIKLARNRQLATLCAGRVWLERAERHRRTAADWRPQT